MNLVLRHAAPTNEKEPRVRNQAKPQIQDLFSASFRQSTKDTETVPLCKIPQLKMNSREAEMEQEVRQATDEVRRAKEAHAACEAGTLESLNTLRQVRDADRRLLEVLRSQQSTFDRWNANMQAALVIIHQRRQNNR